MKSIVRSLSIIVCLLLIATASTAGEIRQFTLSHDSIALANRQSIQVLMPEKVEQDKRYPVLYLLHGAYGSDIDWIKRTDIEEYSRNYDMIIVMPDTSEFSWYVDSPIDATAAAETYMTKELIGLIDSTLPTIPSRDARAICGLSMGGHGALMLAAKHPDLYCSASSLSGILRITNHKDRWHILNQLGPYDASPEVWNNNSVYELSDRFVGADVSLLFDTGTEDTTGAVQDNRETHERMTELGVEHIYEEFPGVHSWKYWDEHITRHLEFHADSISRHLGRLISKKQKEERAALSKWTRHYYNRIDQFREENARLKELFPNQKTIVLLGSSSVEHFCSKPDLMSGWLVLNRGISADHIGLGERGIRHRLKESVFDCNPAHVFILNGRNDLGGTMRRGEPKVEEVAACYREVVEEILAGVPGVQVHIISCFPTSGKYEKMAPLVVQFNRELKKIARDLDVDYIHLHPKFAGRKGVLLPKYSSDGLHTKGDSFKIWAKAMQKALE